MMNNPSNNPPSQANEGVKVSRLNGRQEDTEGNELQLITVRDVRGVSGAGCGSLSFLLSLSATVGDLRASIARVTRLEPEDQELIFCGQLLRDPFSTLGNALQLQSAMRNNPAIVHLDHRRRQSVSSSQNADFFAVRNSLPPRNQDQDTQKQGSMLQEPCEHDFSLQEHWDMHSRVSHTGTPELDTLELIYREQHMILSQMYDSPVLHQTLLSKPHQQSQSINNDEAMPVGAYDNEATVSSWEWVHSLLNTSSHGVSGAATVQNANGANGAYEVGLREEETAAIVAEEAEGGGEKYNVNNPNPRNRLVGFLDMRMALKIAVLALLMVQEGHRQAFYFLLFCMLVFYLQQTDVLHKSWALVRGWYSSRHQVRRRESGGQEINSPDTTLAPVQSGVLSDIMYFLRTFLFSLFPAWEPVPDNQPNVQ